MFGGWWDRISKEVAVVLRKGVNSLVILGAWTLWIHCNEYVFDGASSSVARALMLTVEELHFLGFGWGTRYYSPPCPSAF
jgi:hypothetical protein